MSNNTKQHLDRSKRILKVGHCQCTCIVTVSEALYRSTPESLVCVVNMEYLMLLANEKECRYMLSIGLDKEEVESCDYFKLVKE